MLKRPSLCVLVLTTDLSLPLFSDLFIHEGTCSLETHCCTCKASAIQRADSFRYLGIILDSHLKWDSHINITKNRLRRLLYLFRKLAAVASKEVLRCVYFALVESTIKYGILAWGGTYKSHIIGIVTIQKIIIKAILRKPMRFPSAQLYSLFSVQKVKQLYLYEIFKYNFKYRNLVTLLDHSYDSRSRENIYCYIYQSNKTTMQKHFIYYFSKVCNVMPVAFKTYNLPMHLYLKQWILTSENLIDAII